ncbi:phage scaffolding protein [Paenibacillus polymyxa]|uniref:phage scaffolding protein n=1 Tax=Paenibacillus polymyxa TaxID=1406 RepID=UPI0025B6776A|nr:phage scaffolding protein [Paenibacillus polymyxa]MDN4085960.1 phage scaffolding protein [Paenibacillus polymyxa]MDN4111862.1 phage scaffolding protein [Paenibacillus polymyxa]
MDLRELLGEDLYNQVVEKAGDKKLAVVNDGNWFPKDKFDEVNNTKKRLETDLKERDKQLADLQKAAGDVPALQEQITKLQEDNKAATDKYENDMKELRLNTALKMALSGQAHDPDIVAGLLDKTIIELDDNGAVKGGLDDQLTGLRESKGFLFVQKEDGNTQPTFKGAKPAEGAGAGNPPAPLKGYDAGKSIAEQRNGSEK